MKLFRSRPAAAVAIAAVLSLTATPALARGHWGHYRHHRGGGIDAGDVFAGLLVIGGIAAIASAASKSGRDSREARDEDYRYPQAEPRAQEDSYYVPPAGDPEADDTYGSRSGDINGAVEDCVAEIERGDRRVDSVESVNREGEGWRVQGRSDRGDFTCTVDRDGRVRDVNVGGQDYG